MWPTSEPRGARVRCLWEAEWVHNLGRPLCCPQICRAPCRNTLRIPTNPMRVSGENQIEMAELAGHSWFMLIPRIYCGSKGYFGVVTKTKWNPTFETWHWDALGYLRLIPKRPAQWKCRKGPRGALWSGENFPSHGLCGSHAFGKVVWKQMENSNHVWLIVIA